MTLSVDAPATLFDMAELSGAATQLHWAVAREMWAGGETFALRHGEKLLGVFGLYPIDGGAEAWFNLRPDAGNHMKFVIREIRLTLASCSYPEIVVLCTSKAGSRIARLSGFRFVERHDRGEVWYAEPIGFQQGREARQTASGTVAAPNAGATGATAGRDRPDDVLEYRAQDGKPATHISVG